MTALSELASSDEEGLGRKQIHRIVERFKALGDKRLSRIRTSLTHEQRSFFDLLPLLWHVNHAMLPGFVASDTPAGLSNFQPSREQLLLARRYARGFSDDKRYRAELPIRGLYLMGSMGSLGQTVGSDLDFWLCHDDSVDEAGRDALRRKAALLEERATEIGLHAHFFVMHAESFRDGTMERLSQESSGQTQHTLLLEEFYRTGILLAGNPPLWWIVPPQHEERYTEYTRNLIEKRFIRPTHWLDFGGLHSLPAEEFFGVAHWQLFKGIDAPYKSLLKLMLLEAYASEYPDVDWLCMETKQAVYGGEDVDADHVDPYLLILERITRYLNARNEADRLQLARRAFYFKTGQLLARRGTHTDWRHGQMQHECAQWGWNQADIELLDTRPHWKLERVLEERNALVSELSRSYRLLTDFAREQNAAATLDTRDLALLGRKLYAALDKRPGKIDRVNPGISRDLSERTLWLRGTDEHPARWQLFLTPPGQSLQTPVKSSISLVEILAWLHINGISERSTQMHYLPKPVGYGEPEQDKILKALRKRLRRKHIGDNGLESYADAARGKMSAWFVNVGKNPLASHVNAGYQLISARVDALSFGSAHECLVANIEHLYTTTWGELRVERHDNGSEGLLDCLCRYLNLFAPHQHKPGSIAAYSYSSTRGGAIAVRVARLVQSVADSFHKLGDTARYILRIADHFYRIHHTGDHYTWDPIGELDTLHDYLARATQKFVPTRIDRVSMQDSPLPALMTRNEADQVQVFYRIRDAGIQVFMLDEYGAVFQQWVTHADEYHLLVHLQSFLDSVANRRLLTSAAGGPGPGPRFARIGRLANGDWQIKPIKVPSKRLIDQTELVLSVGPSGRLRDGFRLQLGKREYDSLLLGDDLFREVTSDLRQMRRSGSQAYPVYLTGVVGAEGDTGGPSSLMELLRLKQEVEARLAEAMF